MRLKCQAKAAVQSRSAFVTAPLATVLAFCLLVVAGPAAARSGSEFSSGDAFAGTSLDGSLGFE